MAKKTIEINWSARPHGPDENGVTHYSWFRAPNTITIDLDPFNKIAEQHAENVRASVKTLCKMVDSRTVHLSAAAREWLNSGNTNTS